MGPFRLWRQENVPMFKRGKRVDMLYAVESSRTGGRYADAFDVQRSWKNKLRLITMHITR